MRLRVKLHSHQRLSKFVMAASLSGVLCHRGPPSWPLLCPPRDGHGFSPPVSADQASGFKHWLPIVSIVVPFGGYLYRILIIYLVKPKKGTTMETIGNACRVHVPKDYILWLGTWTLRVMIFGFWVYGSGLS